MKRLRYGYPLAILLGMGAAAAAQAQRTVEHYYAPQEHLQRHFDTGFAATSGSIADFLDSGWTIGGGLTWQPDFDSPLALRTDLDYSRFDATRQLIALNQRLNRARINQGYGEVVDLAVDGEYEAPITPYIKGFAVAGVGVAYRRLALTQTVAYGDEFCDPWFGYCAFGVAPGDVIVASDNTTRFEWNAGLGLDFSLAGGENLFVEARFTRIETPTQPTDFVPIRVGLRF
jgi:Outer membrane protein beta-barrel domain